MKPLSKTISDEIFRLIAAGWTTGEIRRRLGVSRNAVERRRDSGVATADSNVVSRCPVCGAALRAPKCLACWLRSPPNKRGPFDERDFAVAILTDE